MAENCINIDDLGFQQYAEKMGVKPVILATKVKLYNKKNNKAEDYLPTAVELGLTTEPVTPKEETFDPQAVEDEVTKVPKLQKYIEQSTAKTAQLRNAIAASQKELADLNVLFNPIKVYKLRKKIQADNEQLLRENRLIQSAKDELQQILKQEEQAVKTASSTEPTSVASASVENNPKTVNSNTPFAEFPRELQYKIIQAYVNATRIPVEYNVNNQEETLENYDKSYDDIIDNFKKTAWYIQAIADYNNSVLNPIQPNVDEASEIEEKIPPVSETSVNKNAQENVEKRIREFKKMLDVFDVLLSTPKYENAALGGVVKGKNKHTNILDNHTYVTAVKAIVFLRKDSRTGIKLLNENGQYYIVISRSIGKSDNIGRVEAGAIGIPLPNLDKVLNLVNPELKQRVLINLLKNIDTNVERFFTEKIGYLQHSQGEYLLISELENNAERISNVVRSVISKVKENLSNQLDNLEQSNITDINVADEILEDATDEESMQPEEENKTVKSADIIFNEKEELEILKFKNDPKTKEINFSEIFKNEKDNITLSLWEALKPYIRNNAKVYYQDGYYFAGDSELAAEYGYGATIDGKGNVLVFTKDLLNPTTILHELMHDFLLDAINVNKDVILINELQRIFDKAKLDADLVERYSYAFSNLDEFVSEAFGNSGFRQELSYIEDNTLNKKSNIFESISNAIKSYLKKQFGFEINQTLLDSIFNAVEHTVKSKNIGLTAAEVKALEEVAEEGVAAPEPVQAQSVEAFEKDLEANSEWLTESEIKSFALAYGLAENVQDQLSIIDQVTDLILQRQTKPDDEKARFEAIREEMLTNRNTNLGVLGERGFVAEVPMGKGKTQLKRFPLPRATVKAIQKSQFLYLSPENFIAFLQDVHSFNKQFKNPKLIKQHKTAVSQMTDMREVMQYAKDLINKYTVNGFLNPAILSQINSIIKANSNVDFKYQYVNKYNHGEYRIKAIKKAKIQPPVAVEELIEFGVEDYKLLGHATLDDAIKKIEINSDPDIVALFFLLSKAKFNFDIKGTELDKKSSYVASARNKYHDSKTDSLSSVMANFLPDALGGISVDYDVSEYYEAAKSYLEKFTGEADLKRALIARHFGEELTVLRAEAEQARKAQEEFDQFEQDAQNIPLSDVDMQQHFEMYEQFVNNYVNVEELSKSASTETKAPVSKPEEKVDALEFLKAEKEALENQKGPQLRLMELANKNAFAFLEVFKQRKANNLLKPHEIVNALNVLIHYTSNTALKKFTPQQEKFFRQMVFLELGSEIKNVPVSVFESVGKLVPGNYKLAMIATPEGLNFVFTNNDNKHVSFEVNEFIKLAQFENFMSKFEATETAEELSGEVIDAELEKDDMAELLEVMTSFMGNVNQSMVDINNVSIANLNATILEEINKCK